jgi:hypothetical protein
LTPPPTTPGNGGATKRRVGAAYRLELERFDCGWLPLEQLQPVRECGRTFYESPAMIGCALAIGRKLYQTLWGFDPDMLKWGVEDLDFSLKCWLSGHRILHDPKAVVGHRFRTTFDNFDAPIDHFLVNQLRMAWKNFTEGVWTEWLDRTRRRHCQQLSEHPEGLWARVWKMFCEGRDSADRERAHLHGHRVHDEFWYADRFGLNWPRLAPLPGESASGGFQSPGKRRRARDDTPDGPSPSPPPPKPKPEPQPDVVVTFDKAEVRPGIGDSRSEKVTATATRTEGHGAVTVDLACDNARASVSSGASFTLADGQKKAKQVVTVVGNKASEANQDTLLQAKVGRDVKGSVQVTVVVPKNWTDDCLGNTLSDTSPTAVVVPGKQAPSNWGVHWTIPVVFTVQDQFGSTLGKQWAGVLIYENDGGGWCGFDASNPGQGTPISASATATDNVQYTNENLTQEQAQQIAAKTLKPWRTRVLENLVFNYRITDGNNTFSLDKGNRRVLTRMDNNDLTNLDTKQ